MSDNGVNYFQIMIKLSKILTIFGFRLPALYLDPVTSLPYRNVFAFRIIREAYYQQLEAKGDQSNEEVQQWIQWRLASKQKCREIAQNIIELCKKRKKSRSGATL